MHPISNEGNQIISKSVNILVCKTHRIEQHANSISNQCSPLGSYLDLESLPPPTTNVIRIIESNWNGSEKASVIVVLILAAYKT